MPTWFIVLWEKLKKALKLFRCVWIYLIDIDRSWHILPINTNLIWSYLQLPTDNGQYLDIRGVSEPESDPHPPSTHNTSQSHQQSHNKLKNQPPVQFDQPNRWVEIQV